MWRTCDPPCKTCGPGGSPGTETMVERSCSRKLNNRHDTSQQYSLPQCVGFASIPFVNAAERSPSCTSVTTWEANTATSAINISTPITPRSG
ncbi:hypothetical protein LMG27174_05345 [Paraburkholderia rhynchosiae]|uniref:Uncharacterized protein n=1 Tax=Paraburkholderia rhynchosiae TaxID=487049 RepID=A0A6J5C3H1_9BURK|nr:hypothetical protein LMG27174_05345 [Paraburkholderia rhynchosiae]